MFIIFGSKFKYLCLQGKIKKNLQLIFFSHFYRTGNQNFFQISIDNDIKTFKKLVTCNFYLKETLFHWELRGVEKNGTLWIFYGKIFATLTIDLKRNHHQRE